jgi:lipopolysaccharide O-acetyltransferase
MFKYYKIYGFLGLSRLLRDKLFTYVFYPQARLIRLPSYIRGRKGIVGAENLTTGVNLRIDIIKSGNSSPILYIGKNVQINDYVHIGVANQVSIGDNTLIASKVFISDHNHGIYRGNNQSNPITSTPISRVIQSDPVFIGNNVWIGEFVSILPGVSIGNGAVIGTMSVVTKDIPENSIAVGSPAKVIKFFDKNRKEWININS